MDKLIITRRSGKTSALIKKSSETKFPIVCATHSMARAIKATASEMNFNIPDPVPATELDTLVGKAGIYSVLVDDADLVLASLIYQGCCCSVEAITMSPEP